MNRKQAERELAKYKNEDGAYDVLKINKDLHPDYSDYEVSFATFFVPEYGEEVEPKPELVQWAEKLNEETYQAEQSKIKSEAEETITITSDNKYSVGEIVKVSGISYKVTKFLYRHNGGVEEVGLEDPFYCYECKKM